MYRETLRQHAAENQVEAIEPVAAVPEPENEARIRSDHNANEDSMSPQDAEALRQVPSGPPHTVFSRSQVLCLFVKSF